MSHNFREKRAHRRLELRLPIEYRPQGQAKSNVSSSSTRNVSTGGLYFETTDPQIEVGDQLALAMNISSDDDRFPSNSRITTRADVVRKVLIDSNIEPDTPAYTRFGFGVRFTDELKLTV